MHEQNTIENWWEAEILFVYWADESESESETG